MAKPLIIESASAPVNVDDSAVQITKDQLWAGFQLWARGDKRFVPDFVDVEIVSDDGFEVIKHVLQYGKSNLPDGSPNKQKSTFREGYLVVTEYLVGPWFMALYYIDEEPDGTLHFHLTTLRHTKHVNFIAPDDRAKAEDAKPPPNLEQNIQRVLNVIRGMVEGGEL